MPVYDMLKRSYGKNSVIKVCLDLSHITVTAWTQAIRMNVYLLREDKKEDKKCLKGKVDECTNTLYALRNV